MMQRDRVDDEAEDVGHGLGGDVRRGLVLGRFDGWENLVDQAGHGPVLGRADVKKGHALG